MHSSEVNLSSKCIIRRQVCSTVRAFSLRDRTVSLWNTCLTGLGSGVWGGKKISFASSVVTVRSSG